VGGEVIYLTVLCYHPYLVSLPFCHSAIPTFCYILNVFYYVFSLLPNPTKLSQDWHRPYPIGVIAVKVHLVFGCTGGKRMVQLV